MNLREENCIPNFVLAEIDSLASAITERGYDDNREEWDDYGDLLQTYEFRKLVTFELYEAFFPPRRHEFELEVLTQIVEGIASSKVTAFLAGAATSGVVGNSMHDLLKCILAHVASRFREIGRTHDAVREISEEVEKVHAYMQRHDEVGVAQMSSELGIQSHRLEPILKLLGCRARRVKKRVTWRSPDHK